LEINDKIRTVSIIGSGNVATGIGSALFSAGTEIVNIYSRNQENAQTLANKVNAVAITNISDLKNNTDLCIIAVPDDSIASISDQIKNFEGIVVHTSGTKPLSVLDNQLRYGVFYPLQSMTISRIPKFDNIPLCIEGSDTGTSNQLKSLGEKISNNVVNLESDQRQYLHMTAVIVNNFSNLLYDMAHELLEEKGMDFNLLLPLITETAQKVHHIKPSESQTGPAKRKDEHTIQKHLSLLENHPELKKVYILLSEHLIKKYHD
jgi:predicted short-subunit dehydrogenase-like oxidoreductase (DUF2520 family)